MIYNDSEEYKIKFFRDLRNGRIPVQEYIDQLSEKDQTKILKFIEYLRSSRGIVDEPYSKHVRGKIRELRIDFARNRHRIFYFTFIGRNIILLHAFLKNSTKTPESEINKAEANLFQVINNKKLYEG